ncbi:hypothetical protein [Marinobacterium sp. xm-a-152]|uniref:hypothetical protein n=1 Tax=Marinobacterium sp. xm-a-152 TaxID=2497733 RepID=UPI001568C171|nr:hypothetical protein [Marinobacterium sp. xm-a-152]NRP15043.1 hypothetical protein [Marinobacterium sp. xm-a-152]
MSRLDQLKKHLRPGRVYRREDLAQWSKSVDRHARELLEQGVLTKLRNGLYYYPETSVFGQVPPDDAELVKSFLREDDFLLTSFNAYNSLGVGTTQLYNQSIVYNHKRHGVFTLGGRTFEFRRKPRFPKKLTQEFLVVDLLNNLQELAEDEDSVRARALAKLQQLSAAAVRRAARQFGKVSTQKLVEQALSHAA